MSGLGCILVADNNGMPFYSRTFNNFELLDAALLSGLISAIGSVGKRLFNQEIATIAYGVGADAANIVVVTRELFEEDKTINFVFFYRGTPKEPQVKTFREISTTIFMETKLLLRSGLQEVSKIQGKINFILDKKFPQLGQV
jgi:hypothetical protein